MAKETLETKVNAIVKEASERAEELIKEAVRHRMSKQPYPQGFIFAMGNAIWIDSHGEIQDHVARSEAIDRACGEFLDAFGSMGWRIDREDGVLIERTNW
jgi:hypothetical protein